MYLTAEYQQEQKGINLYTSRWQPDERTYKDNRKRVVEPSTMWLITKHTAYETTFVGICSTQEEALNVIRLCGVRGLTTDFGLQVQDDYIRRGPLVARLLPLLSGEVIEALTQSPVN